jgi:hypothetical protein
MFADESRKDATFTSKVVLSLFGHTSTHRQQVLFRNNFSSLLGSLHHIEDNTSLHSHRDNFKFRRFQDLLNSPPQLDVDFDFLLEMSRLSCWGDALTRAKRREAP